MAKKYNPVKNIISRIEELEPKQVKELAEYMLDASVNMAIESAKEIEFGWMPDLYEDIEKHYRNWGKIIGMPTGYKVLDKMTMGLAPGELTIIGGATSNGKTLVAMNIAAKIASTGKSVLFVTLEMTKVEVGVRFKKIMGNNYEEDMGNIYWQISDELNWTSIDGLMQKAKEEAQVDIVIIDHLHYFTRELDNVAEDLGRITKEFKKNAIRHELPVVLISHTRKGEGKNNKTTINDLRGSSYIAQDADIVLMVHKDENFPDETIITLGKNRNRFGVKVGSFYHMPMRGIEMLDVEPVQNFGK